LLRLPVPAVDVEGDTLFMRDEIMEAAAVMGLTERCHASASRNLPLLKSLIRPVAVRLIATLTSTSAANHLVGVDSERLTNLLIDHWERLFEQGIDDAYVTRVTRVGIVHREHDILPKLYIQAYGWFASRLVEDLTRVPNLDTDERADLIASVTKLIFFDMAMAIGAYDVALID
jgi:hypothetical protein